MLLLLLSLCRKYIEVHGRPTSAVFHTKAMVPGKTSYELSWEVESFVTIQEYRLLYRRIEMVSWYNTIKEWNSNPLSFDNTTMTNVWLSNCVKIKGCQVWGSCSRLVRIHQWGWSFALIWPIRGSKDSSMEKFLTTSVQFQKSGTRIKVEAGSDWTNVIIPGDDHKHYSSKQVSA